MNCYYMVVVCNKYVDLTLNSYFIFLLCPVHPVFSLWVSLAPVSVAVLDSKLERKTILTKLYDFL